MIAVDRISFTKVLNGFVIEANCQKLVCRTEDIDAMMKELYAWAKGERTGFMKAMIKKYEIMHEARGGMVPPSTLSEAAQGECEKSGATTL